MRKIKRHTFILQKCVPFRQKLYCRMLDFCSVVVYNMQKTGQKMGFWDIISGGLRDRTATGNRQIGGVDVSTLDTSQIGIFAPVTFYDITQFVRKMRANSPMIVNFMALDHSQAERSLDFVCGAVCALNGRFEKIGEGIYFFAPSNIKLQTDKKQKRT